jgi:hypothetical protein
MSNLSSLRIAVFDPQWRENGLIDQAMKVLTDWVEAQSVKGMRMQLYREGDRTPLLFIEVDPTSASLPTVLLYGARLFLELPYLLMK